MKWKWKKYQQEPRAYSATCGPITLDIWEDGESDGWLAGVDISFGQDTNSYYPVAGKLKSKKKAKKFLEKEVSKWFKNFCVELLE